MISIKGTPYKPAALLMALGLVLAGCSAEPGGSVSEPAAGTESAAPADPSQARDSGWDEASATKITLNGTSAAVEGSGASADGGTVTISAAGTYLLRGTLSDGQVLVAASKDDAVRLVLDGADITSGKSAAIYCSQADELTVTLAEGSENTLTDAAEYTYAIPADEEPDAALFCKDDLVIEGPGKLTVNGSFNNGIGTKDDLVVTGGTFNITAPNHGIRGRDSVTVTGGDFTIDAGNDGIQANNDTDADKGWVTLEGGTFTITSANDAIQAETGLTVSGGAYTLTCGGGSTASPADTTGSYKGLKAGGNLTVTGGTFRIDSADDAVHANGDILVEGGSFAVATGDDGFHADSALTINAGEIDITKSYEGLEGSTINIAGGAIELVAGDDGINAAGGDANTGRFGADRFAASGDYWIKITGGVITINAEGDGLDSNGTVEMSGGEVYVSGPINRGNGALDYEMSFNITGGALIAAGSAGMAQAPSTSSSQPSLMLYYSATQAAGTTIGLTDAGGNELVSFTPAKEYQTAVISAPGMTDGQTYTVLSGGEKVMDVTLSGSVTSIFDTGEAVQGGGIGGFGGRGDGQRPDGGNMQPPDGFAPDGNRPPDAPQGNAA